MKSLAKSVIVALVLIMAAALPFAVTPALASAGPAAPVGQETAPITLPLFLQWLIGGGGSIIAVSWLFERMAWFKAISSEAKDNTIFGAAVVIGCGALAVVTYAPPAILDAIGPYFLIVASTFVTVFIAKVFHRADKS